MSEFSLCQDYCLTIFPINFHCIHDHFLVDSMTMQEVSDGIADNLANYCSESPLLSLSASVQAKNYVTVIEINLLLLPFVIAFIMRGIMCSRLQFYVIFLLYKLLA